MLFYCFQHATGIRSTRSINMSAETRDAAYGDGVYFTALSPQTHTKTEILKNNYGGRGPESRTSRYGHELSF